MQEALNEGRGAILITPHLGNWELGGVTFALKGTPIHALTLKDPENDVQDYRDQMRATLGIHSVHIDPTRFETVLKLVRLLKENEVIAMLGDRWEGGKKAIVNFFNRQVVFPAGAPALALAAGAPIIPVFTLLQKNGRYLAWMESPIRVIRRSGQATSELIAEKTQEIATVFESVISRYPDQWYHFFDYWERYAR
jgi:KDO2-lipid IV(A) lauroyltransferase